MSAAEDLGSYLQEMHAHSMVHVTIVGEPCCMIVLLNQYNPHASLSLICRCAVMNEAVPHCVGVWLPSDESVLDGWLRALIEQIEAAEKSRDVERLRLHPVMQELKELIENDAEIYMFFHQMFTEVPKKYQTSPTDKPQVRDYQQMLLLINAILTRAPEFNESGLVGFPINAILNWSMGTTAGFAAFLNDKVNYQFKKVLNSWGVFLKSKESCYVLNDHPKKGWFGRDAMKKMPNFAEEFKCDPSKPHYGCTSWDDFFTREFRAGVRKIAAPNNDKVIVNACESAPYKLYSNVQRRDEFWIKRQRYSLQHMLANDPLVDKFIGGTIYQAFLSALSYHRWHSPVSGKVIKTKNQDGSYYSETTAVGFDPAGPNESQGYITEVAARAMIFIEASNPCIGLMCFMAVGMAEVSSCEITVYEGGPADRDVPLWRVDTLPNLPT